ncbi:MAG TPA: methyltransferase domain-containing protein [Verrucomicrobiae bacterium]|jgi:precorrin-6B methylase 2|nr:methyltransferase domain-containing protein [Verrucomicrobiae bacterium]
MESWIGALDANDEKAAGIARRRLVARGGAAVPLLVDVLRQPKSVAQYRAALRALGELADAGHISEMAALRALLLEHLRTHDGGERRSVVHGLGRLGVDSAAEAALISLWAEEKRDDQLRVLAEALGRVGSSASEAALSQNRSVAPLVLREVAKARAALQTRQTKQTRGEGRVRGDKIWEGAAIRLRCRSGLGDLLRDNLPPAVEAASETAPGQVDAKLRGSLDELLKCRLWSEMVFRVAAPAGFAAAMAGEAGAFLRAATEGAPTWRLQLPQASRGQLLDYVRAAQEAAPDLLNSPERAVWEVRLLSNEIELLPRFWRDTRFQYLRQTVPAMTHAPLAAALAALSEPRADDVVWDPFCGAGTELAERAQAGPYAKLIGSDRDAKILQIARENLAGVARLTLSQGDALALRFPDVNALITNPPYGRKVQGGNVEKLLRQLLENASRNMKRGRIVLCSPLPSETWAWAKALGWNGRTRLPVGTDGHQVEAQLFTRS